MNEFDEEAAIRVVRGEDRLIGIDELVERLGISRSTLNRWVKRPGLTGYVLKQTQDFDKNLLKNMQKDSLGSNPFPEPATYLGSSPRWLESSVVKWLVNKGHKGRSYPL